MNGKECNVYHLRSVSWCNMVKGKDGNVREVKVGGTPFATVAVEINSDGTVNRGVAICSPHDSFIKKTGIAKAIGRMKKAKKSNENIFPILGFKRLVGKIEKKMGMKSNDNVNFNFLGYSNAEPNEIEKKIFKKELNLI